MLRERLPKSYRRGAFTQAQPLRAPYSITRRLYDYLSSKAETILYDWRETIDIRALPGDILIGHPHPDPSTIVSRAFRNRHEWGARILLFPLHHGIPSINAYAVPLLEQADAVLGIMGKYWYDTLETSFLAPYTSKITRLDMAVDPLEYPFVKESFNQPGRRGYLYIGSNVPEKGTDILSKTMLRLNGYKSSWVGWGPEIPGVAKIASHLELTAEKVRSITMDHDFFVNTSVSDANPTTILESMAWGLPVACTPESGYYDLPSIFTLSTSDIGHNVDLLEGLQDHPEEELIELSRRNRALVERTFTWDHFCETVWASIEPFLR